MPIYSDKYNLMNYYDGGILKPVVTQGNWQIRRDDILENMQIVMGQFTPWNGPVNALIVDTVDRGSYTLNDIRFQSDAKDTATLAFVCIPKTSGKHPAVIVCHQTTPQVPANGAREPVDYYPQSYLDQWPGKIVNNPDMHFAHELALRGYVVIAPDAPFFGNYYDKQGGEWYPFCYDEGYKSATMKAINIHLQAFRILTVMPEVDANRIGIMGHSLGSFNALFASAFEPRIKAIVMSGWTNWKDAGALEEFAKFRYMPLLQTAYNLDISKFPFDFPEVLGTLSGRPVFINAPLKDQTSKPNAAPDAIRAANPVFNLMGGNITLVQPDVLHSMPPTIREQAYQFLDNHLLNTTETKYTLNVTII